MAATAPVEQAVVAEFTPVAVWNTLYPGEVIVDRREFKQKDDPATAREFQFMYGRLVVTSQADLDFVTTGRPHIVREDIPQTSPPLVCGICQRETRSSQFFQKHMDKHG